MSHPVVEKLAHPDPAERRDACRDAVADPSAALLLESLCTALADPDKSVVRSASEAIAQIGRRETAAEGLLRPLLRGPHRGQRWGAAFTLARMGHPEPGLLPVIAEAMASPDGDVRWAAARMLVDTGRLHPEVLQVAIGLARTSESPVVRRMAVFCLRELAPDQPAAATALVDATHDDDIALRRAAYTALAALLDPPAAAWKRLIDGLEDVTDPVVPRLAAIALGELAAGNPRGVPTEVEARLRTAQEQSRDRDLQRAAERALWRIAGHTETAPGTH